LDTPIPSPNEIIEAIAKYQKPTTGGFGSGPNQLAHLASTFAAICTLIGTPEAYYAINLENLRIFGCDEAT
jgi:protein farnesyltransferase subunit beta